METTHGWYDGVLKGLPEVLLNKYDKSIRPMNINIVEWKDRIESMGLSRNDFYLPDWEIDVEVIKSVYTSHESRAVLRKKGMYNLDNNLKIGCLMLYRISVRAKHSNVHYFNAV